MEPLLIVGGAALAVPWWAHHRARTVPRPPAPVVGIPELWAAHVTDPGGPLPGARLHLVGPFEHGVTYRVQLVPGRQYLSMAQAKLPAISSGLRRPMDELVLEAWLPGPGERRDPSLLRLQVVERSPIKETVLFDRPWHVDGRILLGPHADGLGDACYRLYTRNSMWGGFVLGSIGSGKSRLLEIIALTARAMGNTVIVYVDGQNGASSATLWKHATLRAGARTSGRLLAVLNEIMQDRQDYNVEHELAGFTPSPTRPGILVIVDEAHAILPQHAEQWAGAARRWRKVGGAVLASDQHSGLKVFGGLEEMRSSLLAGNGIALRTASRMAGHLIPGLDLDPFDLPTLPGYGYTVNAPGSDGRTAPFRARYLPDKDDKAEDPGLPVPTVEEWFERIPGVGLDPAALYRQALAEAAWQVLADRKAGKGTPDDVDKAAVRVLAGDPAAPEDGEEESGDGGTMEQQVMALMLEHGRMELPALYLATGGNVRTVRHACTQLVRKGMLVKPGVGVYELAA